MSAKAVVLPSGRHSRVKTIVDGFSEVPEAGAGQAITVVLVDELDVSRGDVLVAAARAGPMWRISSRPRRLDERTADAAGRTYLIKTSTQYGAATVAPLKYKVNVNTLEHVAATKLELNEIGVCGLELGRAVAFEPYARTASSAASSSSTALTNTTVGAGLLHFALRRSQNVHWQALDVNKKARADLKGQKPCVLWFTGLSGAGKSTIANLVEKHWR